MCHGIHTCPACKAPVNYHLEAHETCQRCKSGYELPEKRPENQR